MPSQFVVPQFIEAEDRIIGPVTTRQFLIMLVTSMFLGILFKLLPFLYFILCGVVLFTFALVVAFVKVNGMPFHFFLLNITQTMQKARVRVWDKTPTSADLQRYLKKEEKEEKVEPPRKRAYKSSHLRELTLVVDTGGVYRPEGEEEQPY
jgi:hypothetical protein